MEGGAKAFEIFDAKTRVPTRTLYDNSNGSLFGGSLLGVGSGSQLFAPVTPKNENGGLLISENSLHKLFANEPSLGGVLGSPQKAGPLASEFAHEVRELLLLCVSAWLSNTSEKTNKQRNRRIFHFLDSRISECPRWTLDFQTDHCHWRAKERRVYFDSLGLCLLLLFCRLIL